MKMLNSKQERKGLKRFVLMHNLPKLPVACCLLLETSNSNQQPAT